MKSQATRTTMVARQALGWWLQGVLWSCVFISPAVARFPFGPQPTVPLTGPQPCPQLATQNCDFVFDKTKGTLPVFSLTGFDVPLSLAIKHKTGFPVFSATFYDGWRYSTDEGACQTSGSPQKAYCSLFYLTRGGLGTSGPQLAMRSPAPFQSMGNIKGQCFTLYLDRIFGQLGTGQSSKYHILFKTMFRTLPRQRRCVAFRIAS